MDLVAEKILERKDIIIEKHKLILLDMCEYEVMLEVKKKIEKIIIN